jgi:hypothetical protein
VLIWVQMVLKVQRSSRPLGRGCNFARSALLLRGE